MRKVRVLVVDDAVAIRQIVANVLNEDPEIEVVGVAADGRIALAKLTQVNPDIITLDVDMPNMDGLDTLSAIRKSHPELPVIMFSALTERSAAITLEALSRGASDYVTKPTNMSSMAAAMDHIRGELIPKIKALHTGGGPDAAADIAGAQASKPAKPKPAARRRTPGPVEIVAIGVSTGGPNVLTHLLSQLPADLPVPVVIVQHMPSVFTKLLSTRLSDKCQLDVDECLPNARVLPNHIWIAPGDYHVAVVKDIDQVRFKLHQGPPENSVRPAADVLFRSVAEVYGPKALAIVLTGMGQDGLRGCEHIRDAGGQILVQDKESSVVWGMPGYVAEAGLADKILSPDQIVDEINSLCQKNKRIRA